MVLCQIGVGWNTRSLKEACFDACTHSYNPTVQFQQGSCLYELVNKLGMSQRSEELTITVAVLW
jgi:hypothetical protein